MTLKIQGWECHWCDTWHFISGLKWGTFPQFTAVWHWWWPTVIPLTVHSFLLRDNRRLLPVRDTHEGCDCVSAEDFTSQSQARARPHPSQKPHLEATCAQDLGGPEPGPKNSSQGFMQDWDGWINLAPCQSFLITSTAYWSEFFHHIWLIREVEHLVISRGYIHGVTSAWVNWTLFWETWLQGSWKPNTFSAL